MALSATFVQHTSFLLGSVWLSSNHRSVVAMSFIEVEAIHLSQEVGGFGTGNMQGLDSRTLI